MEVYNDSGALQLDQNTFNFGLVTSGEATCSTLYFKSLYYTTVTVSNLTSPVAAVHTYGNLIGLVEVSVSGSDTTFVFVGNQNNSFIYYIFDQYPSTTDSWGVEVLDASGDVTWSTQYAPMNVADVGIFGSVTGLPANRVYAAMLSKFWYSSWTTEYELGGPTEDHILWEWMRGVRTYDTSCVTDEMLYNTTYVGNEVTQPNNSASRIIVLDVTSMGTQPPITPTYSIVPTSTAHNEGSSNTFNITCTNVGNATLYYTIGGDTTSGDFSTAYSGSVSITTNTGSITVTTSNDSVTEGGEYYHVNLRTGSVAGPIVATSSDVLINDTSLSAWAVTPSTTSVNEGSSVTFTIDTSGVPNGGTAYYTISGTVAAADFTDNTLSGSFTVTSAQGTVVKTLDNDETTEGSQTFQLQARSGSTGGTIHATSATVTVNDTSLDPPTITLDNVSVIDSETHFNTGAKTATARVNYQTDGTVDYLRLNNSDTPSAVSDWISDNAYATNYEISYSQLSAPTNGGSWTGNIPTGSYAALGSVDRYLGVTATLTDGTSSGQAEIRVREVGTTGPVYTNTSGFSATVVNLGPLG